MGLEDRQAEAVAAVRTAIEGMEGANWIDVPAFTYPRRCEGWVIVYPRGTCVTPDTPH